MKYVPLATTLSTGTPESCAMKPMTEKITNPENTLVNPQDVETNITSLVNKWISIYYSVSQKEVDRDCLCFLKQTNDTQEFSQAYL